MFYSGFCLCGEEEIFHEYLPAFGSHVSGFSYGAIEALKYALKEQSVKNLILLSPAYYAHKEDAFKEAQLTAFANDKELYRLKLLKKSGFEERERELYAKEGAYEELSELLYFDWSAAGLETIADRGVNIEVFIGSADRVVEPEASAEFFGRFAKVYTLDNKNHILR